MMDNTKIFLLLPQIIYVYDSYFPSEPVVLQCQVDHTLLL